MTTDNALITLCSRIDVYVAHNMCMYEKKTRRAYETQTPTYLVGKFEAMYQFAYQLIDSDCIGDAIDFINDDMMWYYEKYNVNEIIQQPFIHGYVDMCKAIIIFMRSAYYGYLNNPDNNDYIFDVYNNISFANIADAIK